MGTLVIEQYGAAGSAANRDYDSPDLNSLLVTTVDATTSTTPESVILDQGTKLVSILAVEAHRVCIGSNTTDTKYAYFAAGERRSFGVKQGDTVYYRTNA